MQRKLFFTQSDPAELRLCRASIARRCTLDLRSRSFAACGDSHSERQSIFYAAAPTGQQISHAFADGARHCPRLSAGSSNESQLRPALISLTGMLLVTEQLQLARERGIWGRRERNRRFRNQPHGEKSHPTSLLTLAGGEPANSHSFDVMRYRSPEES